MSLKERLETTADEIIKNHLTEPFEIDKSSFRLISAIRYDPSLYSGPLPFDVAITKETLDTSFFYLFKEHMSRINDAIEFFDYNIPEIKTERLQLELSKTLRPFNKLTPYKIRFFIDDKDRIEVIATYAEGFFGTDLNVDPFMKVYLDDRATQISPFTSFKTTVRDHYNQARERKIPAGENADVLLFNSAEQVTETSICNIAIQRVVKHPLTGEKVSRWITPTLATGCLNGVVRRHLIKEELIFEDIITVKSLRNGEPIILMNGIRGVMKGTLII